MSRRIRPRPGWVAPLAVGLALTLTAVSPSPGTGTEAPEPKSAPSAATGGDFRIGHSQPIDSINPFGQQNMISNTVSLLGYDLLLNYRTSDGRPDLENSLTESYQASPDGRTWTFKLRSGITWSDGKPLTSADVRWTYQAVLDNETNVLRGNTENVKKVSAPDPRTVVIQLTEPDARLESAAIPILPEHVFAKYPIDSIDKVPIPLPAVTTAPFRITSYDKGGTTVLGVNPSFRGTPPAMKRVLFVHYQASEAALRDIKLGSLDMVADGDSSWVAKLKTNKDITVWSAPAPGFSEIAFNSCPPGGAGACTGPAKNVKTAVVQDKAIRKALAWGIDRADLSKTIYAGQNLPADGLISPYYAPYYRSFAKDPEIGYGYDPARSRAILKEGGWDCSTKPCVKNGVKAQFEMMVRSTSKQDQNAVRRIRAWASQIGITIDMSVVTEDALNNTVYNPSSTKGKYAPSFDAFYWAWSGEVTPDLNLEVLRTGSSWSDSYYSNPAYDKASLASVRQMDMPKRVAAMQEAQRIALTDLPYIPTVYSADIMLTRNDRWHAFQASPSSGAGSPLGANWLQLTGLKPGPAPGKSTASAAGGTTLGTPAWLALALLTAAGGYALGRRRGTRPAEIRDWTDE
ncbi:ABC transporter substrate-binding protein [Streptomyces sp. NPDC004609]|uniref:ABC transporter substrate-binding protein n=1 Tax=Streptomyces sp. NPDC004609 TaxID=3364704 RepID=UPI0036842F14